MVDNAHRPLDEPLPGQMALDEVTELEFIAGDREYTQWLLGGRECLQPQSSDQGGPLKRPLPSAVASTSPETQ